MGAPATGSRYVLVSPVKDEEKYVETTIRAMLNQTVRPYRWILVDDGSRDRTHEILDDYARRVDWITLVTLPRGTAREPGAGVIRAFNEGFKEVEAKGDYDFVVKLDCDGDFPPDYFERLVRRFQQDRTLGIASGIYLEKHRGTWLPITMPSYHAAGMAKMVHIECFREIGGFVASPGWDSFDEIKAQSSGWKTCHFDDIQCYHLKPEGTGIGFLRTSKMLGEVYYLTGGGPLFFTLKCLYHIITGRPFFLGAAMMFLGYVSPLLGRRKKLVSPVEARFYRGLLNRRILDAVSKTLSLRRFRRKEVAA